MNKGFKLLGQIRIRPAQPPAHLSRRVLELWIPSGKLRYLGRHAQKVGKRLRIALVKRRTGARHTNPQLTHRAYVSQAVGFAFLEESGLLPLFPLRKQLLKEERFKPLQAGGQVVNQDARLA